MNKIMTTLLNALVFTTSIASAHASFDYWNLDEIKYDAQNSTLIKCFADKISNTAIQFYWDNQNHFQREITYDMRSANSCHQLNEILVQEGFLKNKVEKTKKLPIVTASIEGKKLPHSLRDSLNSTLKGASFSDHSILFPGFMKLKENEKYTVQMNRELTKKYGAEYSSKTFKEWVLSQSKNSEFNQYINGIMENSINLSDQHNSNFIVNGNQTVFLIALGIGWKDNVEDLTRPNFQIEVTNAIKDSGFPVKFLKRIPYGTIQKNGELISEQINDELKKNHNVVLVGLSKGVPELILANSLSMRKPIVTKGKTLALLSISGLVGGTFYGDITKAIGSENFISEFLRALPFDTTQGLGLLYSAMSDIGTENAQKIVEENKSALPNKAVYIDVLGCSSEFGLAPEAAEEFMKSMYGFVMNLNGMIGAHDGFLEYPKNMLPQNLSRVQFQIPTSGTHLIFDGKLMNSDLDLSNKKKELFQNLFQITLNLYRKNFENKAL